MTLPRLDPEPLRAAMRLRNVTLNSLAREIGQSPEQLRRQAQRPLAWFVADAYACGLGMHPAEVWGDDWWAIAHHYDQWIKGRKEKEYARNRAKRAA